MTDESQAPAQEPDWAAIRARYEAGAEKVADIAASLGWAGIKLSRHAKTQGWALRGAGSPATPPAKQAETTTKTLQRLKELLQKRLHHLDQPAARPDAFPGGAPVSQTAPDGIRPIPQNKYARVKS